MVVSGGCAGSNSGRIHCDVGSSATSAGSKQLGFGHTGSDWRHSGGSDNSSPSPMQLSTLALQTWTEVWKWRKTRELRIRRNQPSLVISLAHGVATGRRSNIGAWSWDLGSGQLSWRHVDGMMGLGTQLICLSTRRAQQVANGVGVSLKVPAPRDHLQEAMEVQPLDVILNFYFLLFVCLYF